MRGQFFFAIAIALSAMPIAATRADEAGNVTDAPSDHAYRPLVTTALFNEPIPQASPAMLSEPGRLRVTPAAYELEATPVPALQPAPVASGNDLSFLDDPDDAGTASEDGDLMMLWQLVAVFGVVVLVCCVVFVKKSFRQQASGDAGQLELIGTLPLSHRSVLQLVTAGENTVVVASDATGVKSVVLLPPTFSGMVHSESDSGVQHA